MANSGGPAVTFDDNAIGTPSQSQALFRHDHGHDEEAAIAGSALGLDHGLRRR